ncbi:hypothetical protein LSTR_LSTR015388 [Laodelphax striatellus]|uniref:Dynein axonemal intermediate chain 4 n=1 Tax=Laodelphax striatellus TaxID=195883 RepID=A0A482XAB0_LAOST|nr:hypothetical protein LSTR_LSTR015388 [Laodelphax striatellus]
MPGLLRFLTSLAKLGTLSSLTVLMTLQYTPPRLEPMVNKKLDRTEGAVSINVKKMCGLSISVHPGKPMIYYVSTSEGSILKCAVNHPDQAVDIFPGHTGSVYGIKHSPFSSSIFLTYGSDWVVYLWAENIREPLIKLQSIKDKSSVEGAKWSPTHSTIFASISNNQLSLWDLSRKIIVPMFDIKAPTKKLRSLEFSPSGKNILVGDMDGKVFVYNLTDMPFPPFLQEEALMRALENALVARPDLFKKLNDNFHSTLT